MATIKQFEDIQSWQRAWEVCHIPGDLIDQERCKKNYRLIGQLEDSSVSIMDNISEGFERGTRAEFIQFSGYAKDSCGELRSQLYRALYRNYITQTESEQLKFSVMNISGLIQNLIRYLQKSEIAGVRNKPALQEL